MLAPDADLEALTTTTLAAIQGGLLLAKTSRHSAQLRVALDGAIAQLRAQRSGQAEVSNTASGGGVGGAPVLNGLSRGS